MLGEKLRKIDAFCLTYSTSGITMRSYSTCGTMGGKDVKARNFRHTELRRYDRI